jgi:hypothetical protein
VRFRKPLEDRNGYSRLSIEAITYLDNDTNITQHVLVMKMLFLTCRIRELLARVAEVAASANVTRQMCGNYLDYYYTASDKPTRILLSASSSVDDSSKSLRAVLQSIERPQE